MDDSAMPVESMHPAVNRVSSGRLSEGPEYATWRTHGTDDFLLVHTLSGSGRFGGADGDLMVGAGDSVLLRPGVRHDYGTAAGAGHWELAYAHFHARADWMPLLDWPPIHGWLGHIPTAGDAHRRVAAALRVAAGTRSGALARGELFSVNALEQALLWLDTQNPLRTRLDERVLSVTEYIATHFADALDVEALASIVHLSPSRLSHLFAKHLGVSPQRYVERERMLRAQQLLDLTNRPIADIAREVGWDDPLYFSKRFRHFAGASPTDYRAQGRGSVS